jgi:hypothetical protein
VRRVSGVCCRIALHVGWVLCTHHFYFFVNMPERMSAGAWQHQRKAMTPEKLDLLNKYRRRFGLPEV